jgi:ABC-type nitrate/sulfonate/bicarbonate transport system permease component
VFAGIVVSAGLSVALFLLVGLVERLVVPWHRAGR